MAQRGVGVACEISGLLFAFRTLAVLSASGVQAPCGKLIAAQPHIECSAQKLRVTCPLNSASMTRMSCD